MNKLLLATLLLSTSFAQAHHLPVALLPAATSALHAFHTECRVASDPETQVGNGVMPRGVAGVNPDDPEQDIAPEDEAETQPR